MISVKGEIARRNLKYKDVAAAAGIPATTFYRKLGSNAFSLAEAGRVFNAIGVKMVLASAASAAGAKK